MLYNNTAMYQFQLQTGLVLLTGGYRMVTFLGTILDFFYLCCMNNCLMYRNSNRFEYIRCSRSPSSVQARSPELTKIGIKWSNKSILCPFLLDWPDTVQHQDLANLNRNNHILSEIQYDISAFLFWVTGSITVGIIIIFCARFTFINTVINHY